MENFSSINNIESYLTNKMSAAERKFFEAQLAKDPLLQNEVNFHKDVIEGLQDYRRKELKERLNNLDAKGGNNYTGLKIGAAAIALSLIGFGTYYFTTTTKEEKAPATAVYAPQATDKESVEKNTTPSTGTETEAPASKSTEVKVAKKEVHSNKKAEPTFEERTPILNAPVVKEHFEEDEHAMHNENMDAPSGGITKSETPKLSSVEIKIEESKNNKLHYQHYNNKLFLYGDFNSKPYEILELNGTKESKLYLYFEDKYYALKSNQIKAANLEEIKNAKLIESLKALRDK